MKNDPTASGGASYWLITEFPAGEDLERQLRAIRREQRTGSLTIAFEQGRTGGGFTWRQDSRDSKACIPH
jgi:hypothetical protein